VGGAAVVGYLAELETWFRAQILDGNAFVRSLNDVPEKIGDQSWASAGPTDEATTDFDELETQARDRQLGDDVAFYVDLSARSAGSSAEATKALADFLDSVQARRRANWCGRISFGTDPRVAARFRTAGTPKVYSGGPFLAWFQEELDAPPARGKDRPDQGSAPQPPDRQRTAFSPSQDDDLIRRLLQWERSEAARVNEAHSEIAGLRDKLVSLNQVNRIGFLLAAVFVVGLLIALFWGIVKFTDLNHEFVAFKAQAEEKVRAAAIAELVKAAHDASNTANGFAVEAEQSSNAATRAARSATESAGPAPRSARIAVEKLMEEANNAATDARNASEAGESAAKDAATSALAAQNANSVEKAKREKETTERFVTNAQNAATTAAAASTRAQRAADQVAEAARPIVVKVKHDTKVNAAPIVGVRQQRAADRGAQAAAQENAETSTAPPLPVHPAALEKPAVSDATSLATSSKGASPSVSSQVNAKPGAGPSSAKSTGQTDRNIDTSKDSKNGNRSGILGAVAGWFKGKDNRKDTLPASGSTPSH
jgi:hypothetical protein